MTSSSNTTPTSIASSIFSANAYIFAAATTQSAFYTISALLFVACLFKRSSSSSSRSSEKWLNVFLTILFMTTTANTIVHLQFFRLVLVENAPNPKFAKILNTPYHIIPNLLIGLTAVLADSLMVWRCFIIWGSNISVVILPALMTLTTLGMTVAWVINIAHDNIQQYISLGFGVMPLSVATNVLVTALIAFKIISTSRQIRSLMDTRVYSWVLGILVESAALYAVTGLCTVGTFVAGNPAEQVMISVYMVMPSISAYLIVLRVRMGLGYERANSDKEGTVSTLVIAQPKRSRTEHELSTVRMGQTVLVREDGDYQTSSIDMESWAATTKEEV